MEKYKKQKSREIDELEQLVNGLNVDIHNLRIFARDKAIVAFRSAENRFEAGVEGAKNESAKLERAGKLTKEQLSEIETAISGSIATILCRFKSTFFGGEKWELIFTQIGMEKQKRIRKDKLQEGA